MLHRMHDDVDVSDIEAIPSKVFVNRLGAPLGESKLLDKYDTVGDAVMYAFIKAAETGDSQVLRIEYPQEPNSFHHVTISSWCEGEDRYL